MNNIKYVNDEDEIIIFLCKIYINLYWKTQKLIQVINQI